MNACQKCQHQVTEGQRFCENCGNDLTVTPEISQTETSNTVPCPSCQKENHADSRFCEGCGTELKETANVIKAQGTSGVICPSCQKENHGDSQFCEGCGASLATEMAKPKTPWTKKQKVLAATLGALIVLFFGGLKLGQEHFSGEKELDRFITAVAKGDEKVVRSYLVSDDPNLKINGDTVKPFMRSFKENKEKMKELKEQLTTLGVSEDITFKKNGKQWVFFDKYEAEVKSVYADIHTNKANVDIYIGKAPALTSDSTDYDGKVGPLLPGVYGVKAVLQDKNTDEQVIENKVEINNFGGHQSLYLSFNMVKLLITANVKVADVFVNDEKVGKLDEKGEFILGPVLYTPDMTITLKTKVGDQVLESDYQVRPGEFDEELFEAGLFGNAKEFRFDIDATELWDDQKLAKLSSEMLSWGITMKQTYTRYNEQDSFKWQGDKIVVKDLNDKDKILVDGEPADVVINPGVEQKDKLNVVAIYTDMGDSSLKEHHLYLFTVKDGKRRVLITESAANKNGQLSFTETKNNELRELFNNIN